MYVAVNPEHLPFNRDHVYEVPLVVSNTQGVWTTRTPLNTTRGGTRLAPVKYLHPRGGYSCVYDVVKRKLQRRSVYVLITAEVRMYATVLADETPGQRTVRTGYCGIVVTSIEGLKAAISLAQGLPDVPHYQFPIAQPPKAQRTRREQR